MQRAVCYVGPEADESPTGTQQYFCSWKIPPVVSYLILCLAIRSDFWLKMHKKCLVTGLHPGPQQELTALFQTPELDLRSRFTMVGRPVGTRGDRWDHPLYHQFLDPPLKDCILTDSCTGSPIHILMFSIQAMRGLPRLHAPGIVPCIISFSRQLLMVWP